MDAFELRAATPDRAGTRQQLRDWFRGESELETQVAVVDGVPIGHVTVSGHHLVHLFVERTTRTWASADTCLGKARP
ncbi:MAG: hypothetical protein ACR2HR_18320 [Euzebya sp.]